MTNTPSRKTALDRLRELHRRRRRGLWRRRDRRHLLLTLGHRCKFYLQLPGEAARALARSAGAVRAAGGPGRLRQLRDLLTGGLRDGFRPVEYYLYGFYRPENRERQPLYLNQLSQFDIQVGLLGYVDFRGDKLEFFRTCREAGVPTPNVLAVCEGSGVTILADRPEPWRRDLYTKPAKGGGGWRVQLWRRAGDGSFESESERVASREALLDHLAARAGRQQILVQERLHNHPDVEPVSGGSLSTVRMMTVRGSGKKGVELLPPAFRMARADSSVDNFSHGGVVAPVDLETGRLGPARWRNEHGLVVDLDAHPDTGTNPEGMRLPWWPEVREVVVAAHGAFPDLPTVGWDVALTPTGPVVIEQNRNWGTDVPQVVNGPLGLTDYPRLITEVMKAAAVRRGWRRRLGG